MVYTQPSHGITVKNSDNSINYLPEKGYEGTDSFVYQIKNKFGDSNFATVNINVTTNKSATLIRWDQKDYTATTSQSFISKTEMTAHGGVTRSNGNENTPIFLFGNISNKDLDTSKYIQFVLDNTSDEKTIELKKFSFTGRGYNAGNYEIRYSKKSDFSSGVKILKSGTYSQSFDTHLAEFDSNVKAEPKEKIYFRLYLYNNASTYIINYRSGDLGPQIEGAHLQ